MEERVTEGEISTGERDRGRRDRERAVSVNHVSDGGINVNRPCKNAGAQTTMREDTGAISFLLAQHN